MMSKQAQSALRMADFIAKQALTLLEKLDQLELDACADECEALHEQAEQLYRHLRETLAE